MRTKMLTIAAMLFLSSSAVHAEVVKGYWPTPEPEEEIPVTTATAPVTSAPPTAQAQQTGNNHSMGYLGIGVDILPPSVAAQMPTGVSSREGILVTRFADNSPAKISGLQVHDILLAYDASKLIHPKQFIELVQQDKPGREVVLKVLRNGKVIQHRVTLGMQPAPAPAAAQNPYQRNGLVIKQLGKNDYQAIIRFTDASGKQQVRKYRGTREQIYYQAYQDHSLPPKDREQILYAAGGPGKNPSKRGWNSMFPFGKGHNWGSFFPFGNADRHNNGWGGFFPFGR